ncbi:MAG: erythromycin esterase [Verrucomicrobia bacterium]|nr:MAG: erythromycin esterase [Verrucomicrobiota bacterium]
MNEQSIIKAIEDEVIPFDYDNFKINEVLNLIGDKRIILIGDASHGTHEFYDLRAKITQKLIEEKGFNAIAIEGDWPDAYRVNRYLYGTSDIGSANEALEGFKRFPVWMWRNTVMEAFVKNLRSHNDTIKTRARKVGFYGLDLYSIHSSIDAVIHYLEKVDPQEAEEAIKRYSCFDLKARDPERYGYLASHHLKASCEKEAREELRILQAKAYEYVKNDGMIVEDEYFYAEQNARLVKNAEAYYRAMYEGDELSWNTRDKHMAETLSHLERHLTNRLARPSKIVIWAHNSHIGDARSTEAGQSRRELNIGQLAREQFGDEAFLLGFLTHSGTVTAASNWGGYAERKNVRPALGESYEALFHELKYKNFLLNLQRDTLAQKMLRKPRLERFIGVIYQPRTERYSHYYYVDIINQFDSIIYLDKTKAIEALEINSEWEKGELPETYPAGM